MGWDAWRTYPSHEDLTLVFQQLSDEPSEISSSQMDEIEDFVKYVYYGKIDSESLDVLRMEPF